ncbi:MAG TPA: hypothetical protein PLV13_05845 [Ilumatobacteraceae bacterium]|nr:hypothetical protein [Ilumatobacteraceae bacterium]
MIRRRVITIAATWGVLVFLLWVSDSHPTPLAVGGIVAAIAGVVYVALDVVADPVRIDWGGNDRPPPPPPSSDPRVVDMRRQMLAAWRTDSTSLAKALVELVDERLAANHHIDRATQPEAAARLLTPNLRHLVAPARRQAITTRELQRILTDIEAL